MNKKKYKPKYVETPFGKCEMMISENDDGTIDAPMPMWRLEQIIKNEKGENEKS